MEDIKHTISDDEKVENAHSAPERTESKSVEKQKDRTVNIWLTYSVRILPILALLFLCSFLDRTNVGNAKIIGLEEDLNISDHQYNTGLAVFYATYIASELPSNLVLKKISPKIWLPALTIAWGIITMCLGFVRGYASFMAVRALLGFAEGGLLPGMVLYLSSFYKRSEMALRIGLFYTAASLSGAFGGLLARGLSAIGPRGGLEGWRWIFIIEGLITVISGAMAYLLLPNGIESASFLTPEERSFARQRMNKDLPLTTKDNAQIEVKEKFQWSEVRRGILSLQLWLTGTAYFAILSALYSFGLFLPTIINNLNFAKNPNEAQLWSVIPYAVATIFTVAVALLSDRLRLRGVIMLFTLPVAIIGYAVIANVEAPKVRYGMMFMMATGLYSSVPCVLVWNSNNSAGHYKRATTSALQLAIANSGGFVATFIYPHKDAPLFHKGHTIILGLLVYAWFMILFNVLYCAKKNRDKTNGKYDQFKGYGDDRDPEFRLVL
ncbi:MFS general substrate transporter [Patellaria atrata CBS 101060]|uniref:MFS general substrate transporter n=1 Tax=Patellaria atrata CBS 101060 TaxID=1346257 RepID=A0A9P4SKA0_9PEZI|nr:MFS general substrate transporter [Patellaria atrata CBS 101060]